MKKTEESPRPVLKSSDVLKCFGVTDRTLRRWTTYGAPKIKHDRWDFFALFAWWSSYFVEYSDEEYEAIWKRAEALEIDGLDFDSYLWEIEAE